MSHSRFKQHDTLRLQVGLYCSMTKADKKQTKFNLRIQNHYEIVSLTGILEKTPCVNGHYN